jgi:predicted nucleotidyltransferase
MENLNLLLKRLLEAKIDFVLIGGYAAVIHGSSQVTQDVDICAVMTDEQLDKLKQALYDLEPKHRMNTQFQPSLDEFPEVGKTLDNYYLRTNAGVLDILKEVSSVGDFLRIKEKAITVKLFGYNCKVISLDDLIAAKEKMKRPKDLLVLDELKAVRQNEAEKKR